MSVYTVHQPPPGTGVALPDAERYVFVRDGFHVWAFLATALWMLWHRLWLMLLIYLLGAACFAALLRYAGLAEPAVGFAGLLIKFLIGFEAGTLRRYTLARRGWRTVGVVSGEDLEDAERRFFDAWVRGLPPDAGRGQSPAAAPPTPPPPMPLRPSSPDVIGLFPEPGASR